MLVPGLVLGSGVKQGICYAYFYNFKVGIMVVRAVRTLLGSGDTTVCDIFGEGCEVFGVLTNFVSVRLQFSVIRSPDYGDSPLTDSFSVRMFEVTMSGDPVWRSHLVKLACFCSIAKDFTSTRNYFQLLFQKLQTEMWAVHK